MASIYPSGKSYQSVYRQHGIPLPKNSFALVLSGHASKDESIEFIQKEMNRLRDYSFHKLGAKPEEYLYEMMEVKKSTHLLNVASVYYSYKKTLKSLGGTPNWETYHDMRWLTESIELYLENQDTHDLMLKLASEEMSETQKHFVFFQRRGKIDKKDKEPQNYREKDLMELDSLADRLGRSPRVGYYTK
ncbi:hypothetical protein KW787_02440, partial [Candidatus Pacearchaeota archaeon]|nr:hypothetical protein [Candidatus Pacearchaeota archaeon]